MKILVIDNYDSFTYNLVQLIGKFTHDIVVKRNDRTSLDEIGTLMPDKIVISPGPGRPETAGLTVDIIRHFAPAMPILGVCLGHQSIGYAFGGAVVGAPVLMHGKVSTVQHDGRSIYAGIPQDFSAGRYHSLILDTAKLPGVLEVTSTTNDGIIMGVRHREYQLEGIQFHPESVLTETGYQLMKNWIEQ